MCGAARPSPVGCGTSPHPDPRTLPPPPRRILASMDHPFILRLIATYQDEGELYMLLEIGSGEWLGLG